MLYIGPLRFKIKFYTVQQARRAEIFLARISSANRPDGLSKSTPASVSPDSLRWAKTITNAYKSELSKQISL